MKRKNQAATAKARDEQRLKEENAKKPKQKKIRKKRSVPKTVQKTLPYQKFVDDSIIRIDDNHYSKTYRFEDINYSIAKQEEQEAIFLGYCSVLNCFDTSTDIQITVYNNRVNKAKFDDMVLLKHKGDSFDRYIDVYNQMLVEKMEQGQNGIIRSKFLTVTVQATDAEAAKAKFTSIDIEVTNAFKKIGSAITALTANERVALLKDIFRGVDIEIPELTAKDFRRKADRAYCCPDYLEFKKDYFMWGNKYARTMFIKDMPASLKDCLLTDISNTNLDVMVTVNVAPVDPYKALKIVNHQLTSMRANKLQAEKKAIQSGYTSDIINEDLKHSLLEAEELLDDLRSKNQKMFLDNIIIMVTASDMDELNANTETIEAVVRKHIIMTIKKHINKAAAGSGYDLSNADQWKHVQVIQTDAAEQADFAVEVDGDSMLPEYHDGDLALIVLADDVEVGQIGLFMQNGKGFIKQKGERYLISINPDYPNIYPEDGEIVCRGRVIGIAELPE